jgi:uncharacterized protein YraI
MQARNLVLATTAMAGLAAANSAAALTASATTDLNLRAGPGRQHEVLTVIERQDAVDLDDCLEGANSCHGTCDRTSGGACSAYLTRPVAVFAGEITPQAINDVGQNPADPVYLEGDVALGVDV